MVSRFESTLRVVCCCAVMALVACSTRSGDLRALSGSISGVEGTGLILALNADSDGGSIERVSVAAGATSFSFTSQLTEGSHYTVTVVSAPSSPPQTCSVSNGAGMVGGANIADIVITCVTDDLSIGGAISGLEGSGLYLTLTDTTSGSSSALSVSAGASTFLFDTGIPSGHGYAVTVTSAPTSPYQLCSVSNGTGTTSDADVTDVIVSCTTATNSISGAIGGVATSSSSIEVTLSSGGTVVASTLASTSYGFASVATGTTYTIAPSAAGYVFSPASAEVTLSGNNVTQDFTASCATDYVTCATGCCSTARAVAISAGYEYSCAAFYGGAVKCWGDDGVGQLGDGATTNQVVPVTMAGSSYAAVAAGYDHTCGILADGGAVQCWGSNMYGRLGDGTTVNSLTPVAAGSASYSAIALGTKISCGIVADAGIVKCWGYGGLGQLGNNSTVDQYTPTNVADSSSYAGLATGWYHACGVISGSGLLKCWGYNDDGQLGDNTTADKLLPTVIADSSSYAGVSAGRYHSCGVTVDAGIVKCWGGNSSGQLGIASASSSSIPVPVADSAGYSAVSSGVCHVCALKADTGLIKCWGCNANGQLGDNSTVDRNAPVSIDDSTAYSAIAAGYSHTCGITLDAGTVKCWGSNRYGALGDGTTVDRSSPVEVEF